MCYYNTYEINFHLSYITNVGNSTDRDANYNANAEKYGDAIYETSSFGYNNTGSWDFSGASFLHSSYPVFKRGGRARLGNNAGLYVFNNDVGVVDASVSFRLVLLSSQP